MAKSSAKNVIKRQMKISELPPATWNDITVKRLVKHASIKTSMKAVELTEKEHIEYQLNLPSISQLSIMCSICTVVQMQA